jgi:hypothetical protein
MYTGGGASKGALTAGHCFNNGDSVFSGLNGYGLAGGKSGFPTYDMMRIDPSGQTFSFNFYTDPGSPTSRTQTRKIDAPVGATVCTSLASASSR